MNKAKRHGGGRLAPDEGDFRLEAFLPYRLAAVAWRVSHAFAKVYEAEGLSRAEWRILAHLAEEAPQSVGTLCKAAMLDKATASRAARSLSLKGLLRHREDPEDRRLVSLSLSRKGRSLYEKLLPQALDFDASLSLGLSATERRKFERWLAFLEARALGEDEGQLVIDR